MYGQTLDFGDIYLLIKGGFSTKRNESPYRTEKGKIEVSEVKDLLMLDEVDIK